MENNDRIFNLSGLKLLYIGLALDTLGFAFEGFSARKTSMYDYIYGAYGTSGNNTFETIMTIAAIIGTIMMLVGMHRLKSYSEHFAKAIYALLIGVAVIVIGIIAFISAATAGSMDSIGGIIAVAILLVCLVLILAYKLWQMIVFGVADIPGSCGDMNTYNQCMTIWRWLKLIILVFGGSVIAVLLLIYISMYNYSSALYTITVIIGVLITIDIIALVSVRVMLVIKSRQIYLSYHNQLIGVIPQAPFAAPGQNSAITSSVNVSEIAEKAKGALSGGIDAIKSITQNVTQNVAQNINQHVEVSANGNMSRYTAASAQTRDNSQPGQYRINYCYKCGTPLSEGDKFCGHCGTKVPGSRNI